MSIHIGAKPGDIAETVLLPGDPLRAKYVAETFLDDAVCYNQVRGMLGYTGTWKGKRVSVQGTGMGIPSHLIYVHELLADYGVKRVIRVGSCGSLQPDINLNDIVIAMSASTDSNVNRLRFGGADFAPCADYQLFSRACAVAQEKAIPFRAGNILSTDVFYGDDPDGWKLWARFGVLAVEMETNGLYTEAARAGAQALCILTVSDSLVTHANLSSEERELTFGSMMEIALELAR
ncbi:MAG: purine-nucleoside phosphorylase [Spirochaetaceae bacterium]|nr:MAG: purine-nucleoside phosphorylase [Spirochaetaceae bacterium]